MAVFNFNEVDLVTETTEDPRRPIPRIELPRRDTLVLRSLLLHGMIFALLLRVEGTAPVEVETEQKTTPRAFFLPKDLARPPAPKPPVKAAPQPSPPPPQPVAPPTPPPKSEKISVGEAADRRAEELRLERDRDIGRRGTKTAQAEQRPEQMVPESQQQAGQGRGEDAEKTGMQLRPREGSFQMPRAEDPRAAGASGGILSATTRSVERAMKEQRDSSQVEIAGHQMGPLFFDPEGADFTRWINHFKSEVYRNWIIPEPARLGVRGQVALEFTVERDGRISRLAMLSSAGMNALDRAASNALQGSDLLPLPEDYPSRSVTMRVTFVY